MKGKRFTDEQIAYALRQAEGGTPVADVCRQLGVSEASFYLWKKKYARLGLTEIRELRQLRDENARLKRLVADLTLELVSHGRPANTHADTSSQTHVPASWTGATGASLARALECRFCS
jgi:putative transposase